MTDTAVMTGENTHKKHKSTHAHVRTHIHAHGRTRRTHAQVQMCTRRRAKNPFPRVILVQNTADGHRARGKHTREVDTMCDVAFISHADMSRARTHARTTHMQHTHKHTTQHTHTHTHNTHTQHRHTHTHTHTPKLWSVGYHGQWRCRPR